MSRRQFKAHEYLCMLLFATLFYYFVWDLPAPKSILETVLRWGSLLAIFGLFGISSSIFYKGNRAKLKSKLTTHPTDRQSGLSIDRASFPFKTGGEVTLIKRFSSGNNSATDGYSLEYDGHTLCYEDHDSDHTTRRSLRFDEDIIFLDYNSLDESNEEFLHNPVAEKWATEILKKAGLSSGYDSFTQLCKEFFDSHHAKMLARVFDKK